MTALIVLTTVALTVALVIVYSSRVVIDLETVISSIRDIFLFLDA